MNVLHSTGTPNTLQQASKRHKLKDMVKKSKA